MATKYFLFSSQQLEDRKRMEEKLGKRFVAGSVVVNGARKSFTELSSNPTSRYSDAKIVLQTDDIKSIKYTMPKGEK